MATLIEQARNRQSRRHHIVLRALSATGLAGLILLAAVALFQAWGAPHRGLLVRSFSISGPGPGPLAPGQHLRHISIGGGEYVVPIGGAIYVPVKGEVVINPASVPILTPPPGVSAPRFEIRTNGSQTVTIVPAKIAKTAAQALADADQALAKAHAKNAK